MQDVINRLQGLEEMGRITGVMDDRGKVQLSLQLSPLSLPPVPRCSDA